MRARARSGWYCGRRSSWRPRPGTRTVFVNVPFAFVALAMAAAWIPRDAPVTVAGGAREVAGRIDLAGITGFAGAITALLVFLLSLPRPDWLALGPAVIAATGLVLWELRATRPFIDVRLLAANGALARTYIRIGLTMLCVYTVTYGITQWLEAERGMSADETGLLLLPMCAVGALVSRPIARRNLIRGPLLAAALSSLIASVGVLFLATSTALAWGIAVTVIYGITTGTTSIGNQAALYKQVTPAQTGTASGLFRTSTYIGSIASATITSLVFRTCISDHGLHQIAVILTAVSAVVLLMTIADRRLRVPAGGSSASGPPGTGTARESEPASRAPRTGKPTGEEVRRCRRERLSRTHAPGCSPPRSASYSATVQAALSAGPSLARPGAPRVSCIANSAASTTSWPNSRPANAVRIRDQAATLLGSAGTGGVAGNLTTALASLTESTVIVYFFCLRWDAGGLVFKREAR